MAGLHALVHMRMLMPSLACCDFSADIVALCALPIGSKFPDMMVESPNGHCRYST